MDFLEHIINNQWLGIILHGVLFTLLLLLAQFLHKKLGVPADHTRKLVHFGVGAICVLSPFNFTNHWIILSSVILFVLFILLTRKKGGLPSVHNAKFQSIGDLLLPVVIYLNFLLYAYYGFNKIYSLPLIILSISDPAAFYGGFFFHKNGKSFAGFLFFAITAFVSAWITLSIFADFGNGTIWTISLLTAILGATVEYYSKKGWDNFTVPLMVAIILVIHTEFIANGIS